MTMNISKNLIDIYSNMKDEKPLISFYQLYEGKYIFCKYKDKSRDIEIIIYIISNTLKKETETNELEAHVRCIGDNHHGIMCPIMLLKEIFVKEVFWKDVIKHVLKNNLPFDEDLYKET